MAELAKITFVGDIMCVGDMLDPFSTAEGYNFDFIFQDIKQLFLESDFVCGNLETPISLTSQDLTHERYCFNSPFQFALSVKKAGIDFVATANNHCLDRNVEGVVSTVRSLDKAQLYHTGVFAEKDRRKPLIVNVKGVNIGFLSYTYGTNAFSNHNYLSRSQEWMVNLFQRQELSNKITRYCISHPATLVGKIGNRLRQYVHPVNQHLPVYERVESSFIQRHRLLKDIRSVKAAGAELIVMYAHWGGQYNKKETTRTLSLARYLINNGINIIAGSHEHVVHGSDVSMLSQNKVVTYSLGNFNGLSGVLYEPFDKMSEYSIAWHVYIDTETKKVAKTSYSILKTIADTRTRRIKTVPAYDLLSSCANQQDHDGLWADMQKIAYCFAGQDIRCPQPEYFQQ